MQIQLRQEYLQKRRSLSTYNVQQASAVVGNKLLSLLSGLVNTETIIGGYYSIDNEIRVLDILLERFSKNRICLPRIDGQHMHFHYYESEQPLSTNNNYPKIKEPTSNHDVLLPHIILVPMLAFNDTNHRLGYGRGYYDRYLSRKKIYKVGIAYQWQYSDSFCVQEHDVAMDIIVTD